MEKAQVGVLFI